MKLFVVLKLEVMSLNSDSLINPISIKYSTYRASLIKEEFEPTREGQCKNIN
jgi:hypothetical protein